MGHKELNEAPKKKQCTQFFSHDLNVHGHPLYIKMVESHNKYFKLFGKEDEHKMQQINRNAEGGDM